MPPRRALIDDENVARFPWNHSDGVLEVIVGVAMKTISNYTNHIAATPLDHRFASAAWTEWPACACV